MYAENPSFVLLKMRTVASHGQKWIVFTWRASGWTRKISLYRRRVRIIGRRNLFLTNVRERARLILLREAASVVRSLLVLWNGWRNLKEGVRSSLLRLFLTVIYFL